MKQYGFDQFTADLMWKLYQNIKAKEGKNADYVFNRLMGGIIYSGLKWDGTAGPGSNHLSRAGLTTSQQIKAYGLSDSEYKQLKDAIEDQYFDNRGYSDFAHQSITTATYLYNNSSRLANGLGAVKGKWTSSHQHTNHLSGWLGDITIGNSPSMNYADYKADLDAVNIVSLMKKRCV